MVRSAAELMLETPGVAHAVPFAGFDGATFTNAPNAGAIFSPLTPFEERVGAGALGRPDPGRPARKRLGAIQDAFIIIIPPPPVRGIGTGGGFKMMVQDKRGRGLPALEAATQDMVGAANQTPGLVGVFSLFNTRTPKVYRRHRPRARPRCWACRPTTCSRRWRSISARPTSTTSTISAAPTG